MSETSIEYFSRPITPKQEGKMIQQGMHDYEDDKAALNQPEKPVALLDALKPIEQAENKNGVLGKMISDDFLKLTTDHTLNAQEYLKTVIIPRLDYATEKGIILEYPKDDAETQGKYANYMKTDPYLTAEQKLSSNPEYNLEDFLDPGHGSRVSEETFAKYKDEITEKTERLVLKALLCKKYNLPDTFTSIRTSWAHKSKSNFNLDHFTERYIFNRLTDPSEAEFDNVVGTIFNNYNDDYKDEINSTIKDDYINDIKQIILKKDHESPYIKGSYRPDSDFVELSKVFNNSAFIGLRDKVLTPDLLADSRFSERLKDAVKGHRNYWHIKERISFPVFFNAFKVNDPLKEELTREVAFSVANYMMDNAGYSVEDMEDILNCIPDVNQEAPLYTKFLRFAPKVMNDISGVFSIKSSDDLKKWIADNKDFSTYLVAKDLQYEIKLTQEDFMQSKFLKPFEAEQIKRAGFDFTTFSETKNYESLFQNLSVHTESWKDELTIQQPFKEGAEIFGYERMFKYISKGGLSRHDALHAFGKIVALAEKSGLTSDQFYGNILQQVVRDDAEYSIGTAHYKLNEIAQTFNTNLEHVRQKVLEYPDIGELQELATKFSSAENIFASWQNLKRYSELSQILEKTDLLDELKTLKAEGKDELYNYVKTLAFHPTSKVDMHAALEFWKNPQQFLAGHAAHTPPEIQDRKKPSNYVEIPNLDLTAEQLRDALVEGDMDTLQVFSPMEITYRIPSVNGKAAFTLPDLVSTALGSRRENITGAAQNAGKLFSEIGKVLKDEQTSIQDVIAGKVAVSEELQNRIKQLVFESPFGISPAHVDWKTYRAEIHKKSDPDGVLAGNDTACCMPFGDGKNTVYMFNPNTAQFTLQVVQEDGTRRTIAQSVLTKDRDIKKPIPDVISVLSQMRKPLQEVIPQDVLEQAVSVLACDNIEVSPNYRDSQTTNVIAKLYQNFFQEYLTQNAQTQHLDQSKVVVGQGFTETISLPSEPNTYAPLAPVSYSDKTGSQVFVLDTSNPVHLLDKQIHTSTDVPPRTDPQLSLIQGLGYLTFEDTLPVSFLEGKVYANTSLMQGMHNMENGLIAKDINNTAKDRPNMSLKYVDNNGRMRGYMFAYEGILEQQSRQNGNYHGYSDYDDENNYTYDDEDNYNNQPTSAQTNIANERAIYISDLAADGESSVAGGRLIQGFTQLYKQNYLQKDDLISIYAQARETTSFRIIQRQLDRVGADLGIEFELEELPAYSAGEDTMHPVMIRPRKVELQEAA